MCIAVPGEIVDVLTNRARVKILGVETTINTQLIDKPQIGEYVLIHAGCAIEKIEKESAYELLDIFKNLEEGRIDG